MGKVRRHGESLALQQCSFCRHSRGQRRGRCGEIFGGVDAGLADERGDARLNWLTELPASNPRQETDPDQYWLDQRTRMQCCR